MQAASEIKVGNPILKIVQDKNHYQTYIVTSKLTGPTLLESYPYKSSDIELCCALYSLLVYEKNMQQNNMHADNFVWHEPDKSWYMINYKQTTMFQNPTHTGCPSSSSSSSSSSPKNQTQDLKRFQASLFTQMQLMVCQLVTSLLFDPFTPSSSSEYSCVSPWLFDTDPIRKAHSFFAVMEGVHHFFKHNFVDDRMNREYPAMIFNRNLLTKLSQSLQWNEIRLALPKQMNAFIKLCLTGFRVTKIRNIENQNKEESEKLKEEKLEEKLEEQNTVMMTKKETVEQKKESENDEHVENENFLKREEDDNGLPKIVSRRWFKSRSKKPACPPTNLEKKSITVEEAWKREGQAVAHDRPDVS